VRIASPILELPFKAHNSDYLGELEEDRDRMWSVNLGNIEFKNIPQNNQRGKNEVD
jgi:hypothetical protein